MTADLGLRELQALVAVVTATSGTLELSETMRRVARETARLVGADSAVFWVGNAEAQSAIPVAGYHIPKHLLGGGQSVTFPEIPTAMREAFDSRRIIAVSDVASDPRVGTSLVRASGVRALAAIPIFLQTRVFGCLVLVWWTTPRALSDDETKLLETIARQAALALENSRLYEEAERERRIARAAEERYRSLFHGNPAPVFRGTLDGRILECNDAFVRILGYASRDEVLALDASAVYADPAEHAAFLARLQEDRVVSMYEMQWRRADGSTFWMAGTVRLVGEGASAHLDGVALDISDRKRAEKAERQAAELRAVAALAAGTAHEINNPLAVILGNLSLLPAEGPHAARLAMVLEAIEKVREIVTRLGRITKLELHEGWARDLPPMLDIRRSATDDEPGA